MSARILIAGLFHETHTFLARRTTRADFAAQQVTFGADLIRANKDKGSPMSGFLSVAEEQGWALVPSVYMTTTPSGTVEQAVLDEFLERLLVDTRQHARELDGVYLVLHGAMVSEGTDDVEGEVLERLSQELALAGRRIPICGVLDLHGNFTEKMARYGSLFYSYRENPHTDACEAAAAGARLLGRILRENLKPQTFYLHPPIIFPPVGVATRADPMRAVLARAREIEAAHPEVLCINVFAGYSYSDIPEAGFSVTCTTVGDAAQARGYLRELCAIAIRLREKGVPVDQPVDEVLKKLAKSGSGPVLLVEPSDNIGGGTPGDGTGCLEPLLRAGYQNIVAVINDPAAAAACHRAGLKAEVRLEIGAKTDALHGQPVPIAGQVLHLSDGVFDLEDPHSHLASMVGTRANMGPSATVRIPQGKILLTTYKTPPMDLGQLRSQGIVPEEAYIIVIKAAVSHKQAYDPITRATHYVDTPGLGTSNLKRLPYQKLRRPVYPLDEVDFAARDL